ncbi:chorismate synthase [Sedimentibacter saalensis]|uniref:chorismate synthase n=1 Tax=Sedimentibacter saalensis TaxID=130788 RepID=UPI0028987C40|nr:chorismate synthase [Sedimentibacter saalensis]
MSSMIGNKLKLSIFGESHGGAIGVVIDGLPSGLEIDMNFIESQMERRAPGKDSFSTARKESDKPSIVSGLFEGKTTGSPLCAIISNEDTRSKDYSYLKSAMRPGHADYTGHVKYSGFNDYRGGGHFSGRITAPLLFAGALAMQVLEKYKGILIGTRIKKIYGIADNSSFEENPETVVNIRNMDFPVIDEQTKKLMQQEILKAKEEGDSVGGVAETIILNIPAGYGEPFFDSVESKISHMIFSIPAVKGIEFGQGFNITNMRGSESNDPYYTQDGNVFLKSNNNGGILGGITNGMPVVFRTAIKPTPSISKLQETIKISTMENTTLQISGRHDPCIVQRAIPVIDAAAALVVLDLIMEREGELFFNKTKGDI